MTLRITKVCRRCKKKRGLEMFHKQPRMADGHLNICKTCRRREGREYRERNKDRLRESRIEYAELHREEKRKRDAEYRARNRDWSRRYNRLYYEENSNRIKAYRAKYRAEKPEFIRESQAAYRKANREELREWFRNYRKLNPERRAKELLHTKTRQALKRATGQHVPFTLNEITAKFEYWNNCCWVCGDSATAIDHVKPLAVGGAHILCNLRPICKICNSRKGAEWPLPTRAKILDLIA